MWAPFANFSSNARPMRSNRVLLCSPFLIVSCFAVFLLSCQGGKKEENQDNPRSKMLARAAKLELDTVYKAPPGDALSHHTAGYAKIMCSAVFITGLKPEFAAENVGYFVGPYAERGKVASPR